MGIIAALIIGGIAGWLAGLIVRGAGFGVIGNIVIGIIGALLASWLLPQLGVHLGAGFGVIGNIVVGIIGALLASWLLPQLGVNLGVGWVRDIINATIGAVIILVILSLIRR